MNKHYRHFFIFWGCLAALAMCCPGSEILGLFLFIVPGILILIAPTVFFYAGAIAVLKTAFHSVKIPYPTILSVLTVIGIGCAASAYLNFPIWAKVKEIHSQDVLLKTPIKFPDTIAMIVPGGYFTRFEPPGKPLCGDLCQRLLYNGFAKKVLLGYDYSSQADASGARSMTAYSIEKKQACQEEGSITYHQQNRQEVDVGLSSVKIRMAAGECLAQTDAKLADANLVFIQQTVHNGSLGLTNPSNLRLDTIRAKKIEMLQKIDGQYETIYRFTAITAEPFFFPLTVGPIVSAAGGEFDAKFGFFRYTKSINKSSDFEQDFKEQMQLIFGKALGDPSSTVDIEEVLLKQLSDPSAHDIQKLFDIYTTEYVLYRKRSVTEQDKTLTIRCIGDDRLQNFSAIGSILRAASQEQKIEIAHSAIDRILREPIPANINDNAINGLLDSVAWAATDTPPTEIQKKRLENDPQRKKFIRDRLNKNISDGWDKEGRIKTYLAYW